MRNAASVFIGLLTLGSKDEVEEKINAGEDVREIREILQKSEGAGNFAEKQELAELYFAARKRIYPDAPFPEE